MSIKERKNLRKDGPFQEREVKGSVAKVVEGEGHLKVLGHAGRQRPLQVVPLGSRDANFPVLEKPEPLCRDP